MEKRGNERGMGGQGDRRGAENSRGEGQTRFTFIPTPWPAHPCRYSPLVRIAPTLFPLSFGESFAKAATAIAHAPRAALCQLLEINQAATNFKCTRRGVVLMRQPNLHTQPGIQLRPRNLRGWEHRSVDHFSAPLISSMPGFMNTSFQAGTTETLPST